MPFQNSDQLELDHAVATATGEDLQTIRRRGFSFFDPEDQEFDREPDRMAPKYVDWDELELSRNIPVVDQPIQSMRKISLNRRSLVAERARRRVC